MESKKYIFSDDGTIRVIHSASSGDSDLEMLELGRGRSQNKGRYVLVRDCYILQFIISGSGRFCGQSFKQGSVITIRPGKVEVREPTPNILYESAWIMVKGRKAAELLGGFYPDDNKSIVYFEKTYECADRIIHAIEELWNNRSISAEFSMLGVFYSLLSLFSSTEKQERTDPVSLALAYINLNYKNENLKISDVSAFAGVTQNHLCKLFKKETGKSISEFIREEKVKAAANMLKFSEYSYGEIAEYFGFASQSHFIECFRKQTGLSPKEYRKRYSRNQELFGGKSFE